MKPTPIFFDVEADIDNLLAIALLAPHLSLPVLEIFCPRETIG
jgi:hypothetical protein